MVQLRLVGSALVAGVLVGGAVLSGHDGTSGTENPSLRQVLDRTEALATAGTANPRGDSFMEALHEGDQGAKNRISRSPEGGPGTADPTTQAQALTAAAAVEAGRQTPEPQLVPGFQTRPRLAVPEDRYAMAGGCYTIQAPSGGYVHRNGTKPTAVGAGAEPFHFQATDLGRYVVYGTKADFLGTTSLLNLVGFAPAFNPKAGPANEWTVAAKGAGYSFVLADGKALVAGTDGTLKIGPATNATPFKLRTTSGCAAWPEIETNVRGTFKGATSMQETRGYVDLHSHGMTHEFLGGMALCGTPWHRYGVTRALVDCPDHSYTQGYGAILETFLAGGTPGHDTVGWPTFTYWPAPHSLTHQALYYKWLERSWRGGLRVFTNLLTENNVLCELYPLKKNSCNDMDAVRLQAKDVYALQDYIDAQYGGPGRGWYRVVTDPFQARQVANEGKLAVILGIETSVPFDCNTGIRAPKCTPESIDRALDEVYALGVRQLEITNKFDNGLTGVAGDGGTVGPLTNFGNFLNTGHWLDMRACPESFGPGVQDNQQLAVPGAGELPEQDAIFGAIAKLFGDLGPLAPVYTDKPHCNQAGLTSLGEHLINAIIERGMLFDPDHMSVIARKQALDLLEKAAAEGRHPGVISSHSWSTPDAYPRIYKLGGMITPYAGDSAGFLNKWRQHVDWADPRYYFGFGYGADINGFGSQGDPRRPGEDNDVDYPFTGLGGVTIDQEHGGERVWDINTDGVAHYGLYPDWIEDVRVQARADGADFMTDMSRGPEAFLQMWERALGIGNDGCRDAAARRSVDVFKGLKTGLSTKQVLVAAGQPHTRLGTTYSYCARGANGANVSYDVVFNASGAVTKVVRR